MPTSKIELFKKEELNGEVWFGIKVDGWIDLMSKDESEVRAKYIKMSEISKSSSYPKITVLDRNTITCNHI